MIQEEFGKLSKEFEENLQHLATDITTGVLFERLPPMDLWKRAETLTTRLKELAESCKERMLVLKPEQATAIEERFNAFSQGLTNFRDILFQNSADPLANSRLAFDQLRHAVVEGSEFLMQIREVKDNPSPLINEVLRLREVLEAKGTVVTIEAPETVQPMLERLMRDVELLRTSLVALEHAVQDVKERVRALQDNSLRFMTPKPTPPSEAPKNDAKKENHQQPPPKKGQLYLSQFKN
ncbi:MAG: hypothetical protein ACQXXH_01450 [Candidatus Bathyarchaeia archaeon]|jgi:polyhydroxyalkanoate synthesis regulator phasin|nr:hypothetical protein [Candidatus Bathyarchaeota archaeon A05DMB-4]MDH7596100.1 hypothetical protein [Candidatus Bathyarchaeota archaeon]